MPGILALFEDAILNHTAPIIGVKYDERIADGAIGQIDGSPCFWDTILPLAHDDGIVIVKNEYVQEGFAGLKGIFTKDAYDSYYRQLNTINQLSGGRYRPLSVSTPSSSRTLRSSSLV